MASDNKPRQYKYGSISNLSGNKYFSGEWIAEEKVHGSNLSFYFDSKTNKITAARRNDFLQKNDKFYNYREIMKKYTDNIRNLCKEVMKLSCTENIETIIIYGELCGGNPPVQTGVFYSPQYEFIPFDIATTNGDKKKWLDWECSRTLFRNNGFHVIPIVSKGSFSEVASTSPVFSSLIPALLNNDAGDNTNNNNKKDNNNTDNDRISNVAEGFVMRPVENIYDKHGRRVIFKVKNPTFGEVENINKRVTESSNNIDKELLEGVLTYMNTNRLNNVKSKLLETDLKNIKLLAGLLCSDIVKDYSWDEEFKESQKFKKLKGMLYKECLEFVSK